MISSADTLKSVFQRLTLRSRMIFHSSISKIITALLDRTTVIFNAIFEFSIFQQIRIDISTTFLALVEAELTKNHLCVT